MKIIHILTSLLALWHGPSNATPSNVAEASCLSRAIYFEARDQDLTTQVAIGTFLVKFAERNNKTICEEIATKGRYPWYAQKKSVNWNKPEEAKAFHYAAEVAVLTLTGGVGVDDVSTATHFLNPKMTIQLYGKLPVWYSKDLVVAKIGPFEFLKRKDYS